MEVISVKRGELLEQLSTLMPKEVGQGRAGVLEVKRLLDQLTTMKFRLDASLSRLPRLRAKMEGLLRDLDQIRSSLSDGCRPEAFESLSDLVAVERKLSELSASLDEARNTTFVREREKEALEREISRSLDEIQGLEGRVSGLVDSGVDPAQDMKRLSRLRGEVIERRVMDKRLQEVESEFERLSGRRGRLVSLLARFRGLDLVASLSFLVLLLGSLAGWNIPVPKWISLSLFVATACSWVLLRYWCKRLEEPRGKEADLAEQQREVSRIVTDLDRRILSSARSLGLSSWEEAELDSMEKLLWQRYSQVKVLEEAKSRLDKERGRLEALQKERVERERDLAAARSDLCHLEEQWTLVATGSGLGEALTTSNYLQNLSLLKEFLLLKTQLAEVSAGVDSHEAVVNEAGGLLTEVFDHGEDAVGLKQGLDEAIFMLESALETSKAVAELDERRESLRGRLKELESERDAAGERVRECDRELGSVREELALLIESIGLDPGYDPDVALRALDCFARIREAVVEKEGLDRRVKELETSIDEFTRQAHGLLVSLGRGVEGDLADEVGSLVSEYKNAMENERICRELSCDIDVLSNRLSEVRTQISRQEEQIERILDESGAVSEEDFLSLVDHFERARALKEQIAGIEAQMSALGMDPSALDKQLSGISKEELERRLERLRSEVDALYMERDAQIEGAARARERLESLRSSEVAGGLLQEIEDKKAALRGEILKWARLETASLLLDRARTKYERERQPVVVRSASDYFNNFTSGAYRGLYYPIEGHGPVVVRDDGVELTPGHLSRGTREQLYLALRFAFVESYKGARGLPVIMDEVLVNFDEVRARKTVESMKRLGSFRQIFYFTCHKSTVELMKEALPGASVFKIEEREIHPWTESAVAQA